MDILQLYKGGLAYRKKAQVNFCPSCKTVLANEQVIEGKCERCGAQVKKKELEQWFFKITDYAERLLKDLDKINWPEKIKIMQRNWIGRSEGRIIQFSISNSQYLIEVFTTRVDTLFGCSYLVLAPEHPLIKKLKSKIKNYSQVEKYIKKVEQKTEIERTAEGKEKIGIELKGIKVKNPINNKKIPVFVADYVLPEYGSGAVMAVPAHDERDFLFAKRYNLEIVEVIKPKSGKTTLPTKAFEEEGVLVNSGPFSGLDSREARKEITKYLKQRKLGKEAVYYRLRDWLVSRQRYWGCPIPMVFCQKCGWQPVKEKDLPILLPKIEDFRPTGQGKSPLANVKSFLETKCPKCSRSARRETDTMDTFVCSSWYFFRYVDPKNTKEFASKEKIRKWLPVDLYIGGAEHAYLHLLYARFLTKVLKDLSYIDFDEPFSQLFNQGTIYYKGAKMSKSKGNVVAPEHIIKKYGADTLRIYELFMGPADQSSEWSAEGITGCYRFLQKVWNLKERVKKINSKSLGFKKLIHKTIKKITKDIDEFKFNTAVSSLMILVNKIEKERQLSLTNYQLLLRLLAPFAPHISEELWQRLGHRKSIFLQNWPKYNPRFLKEKSFTLIVQVNGRVRDKIKVKIGISKKEAKKIVLSRGRVKKYIQNRKIKRIIFVPDKLINLVL